MYCYLGEHAIGTETYLLLGASGFYTACATCTWEHMTVSYDKQNDALVLTWNLYGKLTVGLYLDRAADLGLNDATCWEFWLENVPDRIVQSKWGETDHDGIVVSLFRTLTIVDNRIYYAPPTMIRSMLPEQDCRAMFDLGVKQLDNPKMVMWPLTDDERAVITYNCDSFNVSHDVFSSSIVQHGFTLNMRTRHFAMCECPSHVTELARVLTGTEGHLS